jgi:hypothetical protein
MNFKNILLAGLLALTLSACALTRTDTNPWLEAKAGKTSDNISGKWTTYDRAAPNWGEANFIQDGSRFYGTLGSYYVDGSIDGDHLYLVLSSGKKVYYTARLNKSPDGSYAGKVVQGAIIDSGRSDEGYQLMTLHRLGN